MNYLGIDVAKLKLDVCLLQGQRKRLKALSNCPEGFAKLLAWCKAQDLPVGELHAVVEGTGCYHQALVRALFEAGRIQTRSATPALR